MILTDINDLIKNIENEITEVKIGQAVQDTGTILGASGRLVGNLKVPLALAGLYGYARNQGQEDSMNAARRKGAEIVGSELMKRATPASFIAGGLTGAAGWHYLTRKNQPKEERTITPNYNINT